eukprot:scaffold2523_cov366-Prasinococcus_capsulatus_cf.AAC.2
MDDLPLCVLGGNEWHNWAVLTAARVSTEFLWEGEGDTGVRPVSTGRAEECHVRLQGLVPGTGRGKEPAWGSWQAWGPSSESRQCDGLRSLASVGTARPTAARESVSTAPHSAPATPRARRVGAARLRTRTFAAGAWRRVR